MVDLYDFLLESNRIERINTVKLTEVTIAEAFLDLKKLSIAAIEDFLSVIQPNAILRDQFGLDVRVGDYFPPKGGPQIFSTLSSLLEQINDREVNAYQAHLRYENLHPFTDGNGRSGRLIWLWQMKEIRLGFLHTFYYQALRER